MSEYQDKRLKNRVMSGLMWTFTERFFTQGISFIVSIILARILSPDDYGVISIITILITILNVFVTSGLGSSLIQKKNSDDLDFSTIFYAGLLFSIILYLLLFLSAPLISGFYKMPELKLLIRILGLQLPITAINSVQQAYVSKNLIFKKFFLSTLSGLFISAIVGIMLAYLGFGVWALVVQHLTNVAINTIVLFIILPWKPKAMASLARFKELFTYGWKILASDLIQTIYSDLRSLAIGKRYTAADLAFYNRGQTFVNMIVANIDASIIKVLFPAISNAQDNTNSVKRMTRRSIQISSYVISPLLIGLAVIAKPLVQLLLTEKWLPSVPYIQILCLANLFQPMHSANLQAIKAIGRSGVLLRLELFKKTYSVIILILSIILFSDPFMVAVGFVISTFLSIIVNAYPNKKLLDYGYIEQLKDIFPNLLMSFAIGGLVHAISYIEMPVVLLLVLQINLGIIFYIVLSLIFRNESMFYLGDTIKSFSQKSQNRQKK